MKTRRLPMPDWGCLACIGRLILAAVILLVTASTGFAADHPEQDAQRAVQTGVDFQPRLGDYHYEISWAFKRVATGVISIRREGDHYVLTSDQRTTKLIDRTYRVRYRGETRIDAAALTPSESVIEEEVKKRRKVQKATYDPVSGSVSVEETRTKGKRVETKTYELQSDTAIMDLFSSLFLARSFDWDIGERHAFQVFIGEKQYAVALDCIGRSTYELEGKNIPVWVIQPFFRKLTDETPSSRKHRIFIAADESKDIVKVESQPGIGTVTLRLVRYLEQQ